MTLRVRSITVDSTNPRALGRWWADLLGWRITDEEEDELVIGPAADSEEEGIAPDMVFVRVPELKSVKNRLHLDLRPDNQQAETARAIELGATPVDVGQSDDMSWTVLADPEGNEFCILRALTVDELRRLGRGPSS